MRSRQHAVAVTAAAVFLVVIAGAYTVTHFSIDTSATRLLFRGGRVTRLNRELARDFPSLGRRIIVVVQGHDSSGTAQAVHDIVSILQAHPRTYPFVYAPTSEPIFTRDGLLYLPVGRLRAVLRNLARAEPILGTFLSRPNFSGYARFLNDLIRHADRVPDDERGFVLSIINKNITLLDNNKIFLSKIPTHSSGLEGPEGLPSLGQRISPIIVSLPKEDASADHAGEAVSHLENLLKENPVLRKTHASWALTGSVVLSLDQLRDVTAGTDLATILSVLLSIVLLIIGLRSVRLLLPILITLIVGLICTAAFALLALGPLNMISVAFGVLFIGLGVDFSIQFCIRLQEELAKQSDSQMAYNATAYRIGLALILAALAAASCFYAVIPTGYSGIRALGIIAGTGSLIALVLNLTLLPALLTLFHAGRTTISRPPIPFAKLPVEKMGRPVLSLSLVILAGSILILPRLNFDFDLAHLENQHSQAVQILHKIESRTRLSPYTLEAVAPSLAVADRWAKAVRHLPAVGRVLTLDSYIPSHQTEKLRLIANVALLYPPPQLIPLTPQSHQSEELRDCSLLVKLGKVAANRASQEPQDFRAPLMHLSETLQNNFGKRCPTSSLKTLQRHLVDPLVEQANHVTDFLSPQRVSKNTLPSILRADYLASSGHARVEIFSRLNLHKADNLRIFVDQVTHVIPDVGGTPVLFVRGGKIVTAAFREASLLAFLFIVLVVSLVLRNPRDVVLTMIPLIISVALTLMTMFICGLHFNIANIIVIPLSIGLSVAFGIYMILRWKNNHYDIRQVLRSSVPEGILVSGMTTLLVFGTLVLTPSPGLYSLGLTLLIALVWTLISSLVMLPSILYLVGPPHRARLSGKP